METNKYKHIERRGNELIIKTPIPYRVVRQYPHETNKDAENKEYKLNQSCQFLYDVLKLLGITKKSAAAREYTLNISTGDRLTSLAGTKNVSTELYMLIKKHDW